MKRFIDNPEKKEFDLIIIGGGITGAATAYEASSKGLSVLLIEKKDFGWATSAATSKLIHGGLRYLNNLEFSLVRESLRERRILSNIAPNFVYPLPFLIPGYNTVKTNKWIIRLGMILYDILSYDKKRTWDKNKQIPNHSWLSKKQVLSIEPGVKEKNLTGGSVYYDSQSIFPERLTLAFIKSAIKYGAEVTNYTDIKDFIKDDNRITGVTAIDIQTGVKTKIYSKLIINCAGPWVDRILDKASHGKGTHVIRRSEGIHIITNKIVNKNAVVLMTPAGRHFFIVPWRDYSLIGTTDTEYKGDPDKYSVRKESIEGLIKDVNDSYGDGNLTYKDVIFAFGGLRPLVDDQTEGTYESSRKYEINDNAADGLNGLITIEGGKFTTSRHLAENAVNLAFVKLGEKPDKSETHQKFLSGCEIKDLNKFISNLKDEYSAYDNDTLEYIGRNYGTDASKILKIADEKNDYKKRLTPDGQLLAEVVFAARHEMPVTLDDIIFRRTGIGNIGHPGKKTLELIAETAAKELKWNTARKKDELKKTEEAFRLPQ